MRGVRRPISSKPGSCTERAHVDAAGISGEVGAHYPGRSVACLVLLPSRGGGMGWQKSAEGIVGLLERAEGLNVDCWTGA